jgi:hypothetical protein
MRDHLIAGSPGSHNRIRQSIRLKKILEIKPKHIFDLSRVLFKGTIRFVHVKHPVGYQMIISYIK